MNTTPQQPERDPAGLCPEDEAALDRLLDEGSASDSADAERMARMRSLLVLLGHWQVENPPQELVGQTLSQVLGSEPVQLSVEDGEALDALLALRSAGLQSGPMPARTAPRAERLRQLMSLLDHDEAEPVPGGLTERTMKAIEADRAEHDRLVIGSAMSGRSGRGPGITIRQIATTAALLLMVLSVLLPILDKGRRDAMIASCSENLAGLGLDLTKFARDNKDATVVRSVAPAPVYAQPSDAFQVPANNNPNLVLILSQKRFESDHLLCPAATTPATRLYNGQNPIAGGPLRLIQYSDRPVFADSNPLYRITPTGLVRIPEVPGLTVSNNHAGKGQNVLFGDGSVRWMVRPTLMLRGSDQSDNIWLLQKPADPSAPDVFLTP